MLSENDDGAGVDGDDADVEMLAIVIDVNFPREVASLVDVLAQPFSVFYLRRVAVTCLTNA